MNVTIAYRSMTGHSKKISRAIASAINASIVNIKKDVADIDTDLLFIVGGIYSGKGHPDVIEFVKKLQADHVKKVALITSSVNGKRGQDEVRQLLIDRGIAVVSEEYCCHGNFLFIKMTHPNKKEIEGAVDFAKDLIK